MKLHQLKAFLTVVDKGSFSEAALDLKLSQASVSHAVAELERSLATRLLERGRFGARPTAVGSRVASHARAIMKSTDALMQEVTLEQGRVCGRVAVTCFRSAASKIIPKVITQLRQSHQGINVEIFEVDNELNSGEKKRRLVREHKADIAFLNKIAENEKELISWELCKDSFMALVPSDYPKELYCWQEALNVPLIFDAYGSAVERYLKSLKPDIKPAYAVREDSTLVRMASEGLGMAFLASLAIDELPANLKALPTDVKLERSIYIALLPSSLKVPAVRAFLKVLKDNYPESELPAF